MVAVLRKTYAWAEFELEPDVRRLSRQGEKTHLTKKPFGILVYLIENRDRVVTREELLEKFWDGHDVYEETLTKSIGAIRKALGESPESPRYIETRWAEGYRFIGEIEEAPQSLTFVEHTRAVQVTIEENDQPIAERHRDQILSVQPPPVWRRPVVVSITISVLALAGAFLIIRNLASPAKTPQSLAVLPLANLTGDDGAGYLSDGITENLINAISRDSRISVVAPGSSFAARDRGMDAPTAAKNLNVEAVLTGSVQRDDEILRVAIRLIDGSSGQVLWTKEFARPSHEIFALQDEVAKYSAAALSTEPDKSVTPGSYGTSDVEAYVAYLKGRHFWHQQTEENTIKAITNFEEAVRRDPNFALAYCGLSDSYNTLGFYFRAPNETMPKAEEYAAKALGLNPDLADAYFSDASAKFWYRRDLAAAEVSVKRAIEMQPDSALAHDLYGDLLLAQGRRDEGLGEVQKATQLDPLAHFSNCDLGWQYFNARRYSQAIAKAKVNLETVESCPFDRLFIGESLAEAGNFDDAESELRAIDKYNPDWVPELAQLGYINAIRGRNDEARKLEAKLQAMSAHQFVDPYAFAVIDMGLGDNDGAFKQLEAALGANSYNLAFLRIDPRFDRLKSDPRFHSLLERAGLVVRT